MNRIKMFNETNGPASGKEEDLKRRMKFIPVDTKHPSLLDDENFDDSIPGDNIIDEDEDANYKPKIIKRIKNFKEDNKNKEYSITKEEKETNYNDYIKEEFTNIYKFSELIDFLTVMGYDKGIIFELLIGEYRKGGDDDVIKTFNELTELSLEVVSKGRYGL